MAGVKRRATIKVDADVSGAVKGLKKVEKSVRNTEEDTARLAQTWRKLGSQMESGGSKMSNAAKFGLVAGVAAGAVAAVNKLRDLGRESLQIQAVFKNLEFALEGAAAATMGLVDNATLAQAQVRALELGAIDSAQGFEDLSEAGAKLGLIMGGDAAKGVDDLAIALSRGSPKILDNLGITLSLREANEEYAKQIGKTVSQLTEAEKTEAFRTVGLQRALEASRDLNIEDSAALKLAQAEVIASNLRTEALGGTVSAQVKLNTALELMGDEIKGLDVINYGTDMEKVQKILSEFDAQIGEDISLREVQNALIEKSAALYADEAAAIEDAAEAQRVLQAQAGAALLRGENDELEQHIKLLQATGADHETIAKLRLRSLEIAQLTAIADSDTDDAAFARIHKLSQEIQIAKAGIEGLAGAGRKRGGGRRGRARDAVSSVTAAREKSITDAVEQQTTALRRNLEILEARDQITEGAQERILELAILTAGTEEKAEARHELELFHIEQEMEAKSLAADAELARLEAQEEARERTEAALEAAHQAELDRLEAEARAHAEKDRKVASITRMTASTLADATEAAITSKDDKAKAFGEEVGAFAASRSKILAIDSITHFALAAAAFATGRVVKGTAELVAGGKSAAASTALAVLASQLSSSGADSSLPGGGADFGGAAPSGGGLPQGQSQANTAPVSPLERNGQPAPAANQGPAEGGGLTVNVHGSVISGGELQEIINDAQANGGQNLRGGFGS